jgi:hypothetical protein
MSFIYQHRTMHAYRTSYSVLQTPKQNNAYHFVQATMSFIYQHRTMHVMSDTLRCPINTNTEQCMTYRKSYDVLQTLEKQCMSYQTSYDVLQTLTQNNTCHIGQDTMSYQFQYRTMNVISDKLRCPSDTNTEQYMSYRKCYDVLQTVKQNNACHIGQAKMSFRHYHRTIHVISDKLRYPSDTKAEQSMS